MLVGNPRFRSRHSERSVESRFTPKRPQPAVPVSDAVISNPNGKPKLDQVG